MCVYILQVPGRTFSVTALFLEHALEMTKHEVDPAAEWAKKAGKGAKGGKGKGGGGSYEGAQDIDTPYPTPFVVKG